MRKKSLNKSERSGRWYRDDIHIINEIMREKEMSNMVQFGGVIILAILSFIAIIIAITAILDYVFN
jgi:hypothetical protein